MLIIAISYYDNYIDRVEKIVNENPKKVTYLYVEDFLKNPDGFDIEDNSVIYILNNSNFNLDFIQKIKQKSKCKILNDKFFNRQYSKLDIQRELEKNNVLIPRIIKYNEISKNDFPIFCKSYQHADMVLKIYNRSSLNSLMEKFDVNNFYFEESVDKNNYKEYKVYFIKNNIYLDDDIKFGGDDKMLNICCEVGKVLGLDVFSCDIIVCDKKYYMLDVNPSAGLYKSKKSRQALIKGN